MFTEMIENFYNLLVNKLEKGREVKIINKKKEIDRI
jgi:hypothetical protein